MAKGYFCAAVGSVTEEMIKQYIENEDIIELEYIKPNLDAARMPLGYCMKPKKQLLNEES